MYHTLTFGLLSTKPCPFGSKPYSHERMVHIEQLDPSTGRVLRVFESILDACSHAKCRFGDIHLVLSSRKETAGGYGWRLADPRFRVRPNDSTNTVSGGVVGSGLRFPQTLDISAVTPAKGRTMEMKMASKAPVTASPTVTSKTVTTQQRHVQGSVKNDRLKDANKDTPVEQYNLTTGETTGLFVNVDATKSHTRDSQLIRDCCINQRKEAYGFGWRYLRIERTGKDSSSGSRDIPSSPPPSSASSGSVSRKSTATPVVLEAISGRTSATRKVQVKAKSTSVSRISAGSKRQRAPSMSLSHEGSTSSLKSGATFGVDGSLLEERPHQLSPSADESPNTRRRNAGRPVQQINAESAELLHTYDSVEQASELMGIDKQTLLNALSGKRSSIAKYCWQYVSPNDPSQQPVEQYQLNTGATIRRFDNLSEAARITKLDPVAIGRCTRREQASVGGFGFRTCGPGGLRRPTMFKRRKL